MHRLKIWQQRYPKLSKVILAVLGILFLIWIIIWVVNSISNSQVYSALENTKSFTPQEATSEATLAQLNSLFELPDDKKGTMAKIKDVKSLASKKAFFNKARNGQILVFYDDMTIIYDPVNKNVVDIARTNLLK